MSRTPTLAKERPRRAPTADLTLRGAVSSSIGGKIVLAVTGGAMALFLVGHLAGNLLLFVGPGVFNSYADKLIKNPLLIPIELALAAIFLTHVAKATTMWMANHRARPVPYHARGRAGGPSRKSLASSSMILTGAVIAMFVPLHIKTFKFGAHYEASTTGVRDLHKLVFEVFQSPAYVVFYVLAMVVVGLHLRHGVASAFQSLGADHPHLTPRVVSGGKFLAIAIGGAFAAIPLVVYFLGSGR